MYQIIKQNAYQITKIDMYNLECCNLIVEDLLS